MGSVKGVVFDIQRYSVHDGPGIRTIVFVKGCPLRCLWCSNPEGMRRERDMLRHEALCSGCMRCVSLCPSGAIGNGASAEGPHFDRSRCSACGVCADNCPAGALSLYGKEVTVDDVLDDVCRDAVFYKRSGGGLTVSGGEPLLQPEFSAALLREARERGINTAVETSCHASSESMRSVLSHSDTIFCDIKLVDKNRHIAATGVDNSRILENIGIAAREFGGDKVMVLRMPLIPSLNDDADNIRATAEFIAGLARKIPLEVLAYHEFAKGKYRGLDMAYVPEARGIAAPDQTALFAAQDMFRSCGVDVVAT